jgi:hypothetical protein
MWGKRVNKGITGKVNEARVVGFVENRGEQDVFW